jgi:formate C-acetyltransferase
MEALVKREKLGKRVQVLLDQYLKTERKVCTERAEIITKAYKELDGVEIHKKRALALKRILEEISISIWDGELIVGNLASGRRDAPLYPEFSWEWIVREADDWQTREVDTFIVAEATKKRLREVIPWWKGKTVRERALEMVPQDVIAAFENGMFTVGNYLNSGVGHVIADYEKVIKYGYREIIGDIQSKLNGLNYTDPKDVRKRFVYESMIIALEAGISFANRYAELAEKKAELEKDERRREELLRIAQICKKVPEFPAHDLYEAMQSFWFTHLMLWIESNGNSVSPGRFDQYMYPFYRRDLEQEKITPDDAVELIECLYIKLSEIIKIYNNATAKLWGGFPQGENMILGGVNSEGEDVTNEFSFLCLEAMKGVITRQPDLSVRVHHKTPERFLREAVETCKIANSQPKFFNDEVIISALLIKGVSLSDARNYGHSGCTEVAIPGKTNTFGVAAMTNFGKCLELTLFNGIDPITGVKLGLESGSAESFSTFEEFFDAYSKQYYHLAKQMVIATNCIQEAHKELAPQPFLSCFISDCIKDGRDFLEGGAQYDFTGPHGVGVGSVADAMAALKKLVFEEGIIKIETIKEALRNNFEGEYEKVRHELLNKAPKYGNGDPYVDKIARDIAKVHCLAYENYVDPRGGTYAPGFATNTAGIMFGKFVGATPDGRRYGEPLSDGVSPVAGRDIEGPTAAMRSVATIDFSLAPQGGIFNLKFTPQVLNSQEKINKLASLIRGYCDAGGYHVQFNIIDDEILRDAQRNPEKYRGLLVRVAGWVAYFVELAKPVQDEIIRRYSHSL